MGWKDNKNLGSWAFTKQADKPSYNEGDHIATYESPIWSMVEGSNVPITPTHKPCGYWTKDYVLPPPLYSLYFYIAESTGLIKIARISRSSFTFVDYMSMAANEAGCQARGVLRKNNNRNIAYKDANGNSYVGDNQTTIQGRIIKFNLSTMIRIGAISIVTEDNRAIFGGVVDSTGTYSYWLNMFSSYYGEKCLQKVDMETFSIVTSISDIYGAGKGIGYNSSIEIDEANNRIYVVVYRVDPYYLSVMYFSISPFAYVGAVLNVAPGYCNNNNIYSSGLTRIGTKVLFIGHTSTTSNTGPGVLVRANVPNIDGVTSLIFDTAEGNACGLVIDSAGQYAYVFCRTNVNPGTFSVVKVDITTTPMTKIGSVGVSAAGLAAGGIAIDEIKGYIYFSNVNVSGRVHRVSISPFAYVGYMDFPAGQYPYYDIFTED